MQKRLQTHMQPQDKGHDVLVSTIVDLLYSREYYCRFIKITRIDICLCHN